MDKYLCKNRYRGALVIYSFDEKPSYDPLLDYWDGEGKRILSFEEARPYLIEVQFHNSPYKIKKEIKPMKDLEKQIEEEASFYRQKTYQERVLLANSHIDSIDIALAVKHGANFVLQKWQEAERWRKVEEELPEYKGEGHEYQILVKLEDGFMETRWVYMDSRLDHYKFWDIVEWKPIN